MQFQIFAVRQVDFVHDARRGGNQIQIEFAFQPLFDDFHVQQSQEPAPEALPQRRRFFWHELETGVVQLQFRQSVAQRVVITGIQREHRAENDGNAGFKSGESLARGAFVVGDRIADFRVADRFNARRDKAEFARAQFRHVGHFRRENADAFDVVHGVVRHHANFHALLDATLHHPNIEHHALISIKFGVKNKSL